MTYQTVKLTKGKHPTAEHGVCVMELASMLAGEKFSDHPESVCPVIGSFLRTYNDTVDDTHRQDLYAYAAKVVGTRASAQVEALRRARLRAFIQQRRPLLPRLAYRLIRWEHSESGSRGATLGVSAARSIRRHTDAAHAGALALIDELVAIGAASRSAAELDLVPLLQRA